MHIGKGKGALSLSRRRGNGVLEPHRVLGTACEKSAYTCA